MKKVMPIGFEDFKEIIDKGMYYADKTYLIKELIEQHGKVNLSLKSAKQPSYEMAYKSLKGEIAKEFSKHNYLLCGEWLNDAEKERFRLIEGGKAEDIIYAKALDILCNCLEKYHKKKAIILIDEFEVHGEYRI